MKLGIIKSTTGRLTRALGDKRYLKNGIAVAKKESIILEWPVTGRVAENWGDKLNPVMVELLGGPKPVPRSRTVSPSRAPVHYMIGSGLGGLYTENSVVYGTGFNRYDITPHVKPMHLAAVRGPLTAQKYKDAGIDPPDVVGDMALLLPSFYQPAVPSKNGKIKLIPHFREFGDPEWASLSDKLSAPTLDICDGLRTIIDEVASARVVLSSSLHGLILADAYGIPSIWVRGSDKPMGDLFKFHDYFASVGRKDTPLNFEECLARSTESVLNDACQHRTMPDLDALEEACPFAKTSRMALNGPRVIELLDQGWSD